MAVSSETGKRARTRARLIDIAFDLFLENGIEGTSLAAVAACAGATKGAVYSSFRSKAELVIAVLLAHPLAPRPILRAGMTRAEVYRALGEAAAAMLPTVDRRAALEAEFHLYSLSHPEVREALFEHHRRILDRGIAQVAALNPDEPAPTRQMALTVQALTLGLAQQRRLTPDLVREQDVVAAFEALA